MSSVSQPAPPFRAWSSRDPRARAGGRHRTGGRGPRPWSPAGRPAAVGTCLQRVFSDWAPWATKGPLPLSSPRAEEVGGGNVNCAAVPLAGCLSLQLSPRLLATRSSGTPGATGTSLVVRACCASVVGSGRRSSTPGTLAWKQTVTQAHAPVGPPFTAGLSSPRVCDLPPARGGACSYGAFSFCTT